MSTEDYSGELDMLRGLVATLRAIAEHGDLPDVRKVLAEHAADDAEARAEAGEKSSTAGADATPAHSVRQRLADMIRTDPGDTTVWSVAEIRNALHAFYRDAYATGRADAGADGFRLHGFEAVFVSSDGTPHPDRHIHCTSCGRCEGSVTPATLLDLVVMTARHRCEQAAADAAAGLSERQQRLLDAIRTFDGEWTTARVLRLYALTDPGVVQRGTARRDLAALQRAGHLVLVDDPDNRHYVLHRKGGNA